MPPKDSEEIATRVDPDQAASLGSGYARTFLFKNLVHVPLWLFYRIELSITS